MTDDRSEVPSDEADQNQINMAKAEGAAYQRSLMYMVEEVADNGAKQEKGDYIIGIAQERAEGMYQLTEPGKLEWMEPAEDDNCHLEVSVSDIGDQRFIPQLTVRATIIAESGEQVGPFEVPFLWHPGLYHYGKDIKVPGDGKYTVRVEIDPPTFMRHDEINGKRFAEKVTVEFPDFEITTGKE